MVVDNVDHSPHIWISRDTALSGMYSIWINGKPALNKEGYYKFSNESGHASMLLMTIHPGKYPWDELKLTRGECIEVELNVVDADSMHTIMEETC